MAHAVEVRVFTKKIAQGNPAIVITGFTGSEDRMQAIATDFGRPVTTFLLPSNTADVQLRYFTPRTELPACGHGTLGAAHYLLKNSSAEALTIETQGGRTLSVKRRNDGLLQLMIQQMALLDVSFSCEEVCNLFGLTTHSIDPKQPFCVASVGSPKLLFPIKKREILISLNPDFSGIAAWSARTKVNGIYAYTQDTIDSNSAFHARSFNPLMGEQEDAATGVAAAALAGVVALRNGNNRDFIIEQGDIMNRASRLFVSTGEPLMLGGYAVTVGSVFSNYLALLIN